MRDEREQMNKIEQARLLVAEWLARTPNYEAPKESIRLLLAESTKPPASQFVADMFWKEEPDGEGSASSPEDVIADLMDWSGSRGPDIFKLQQAMSGPPLWCVGVWDAAGQVTVTEYPSEAEAKAAIPTPPEPDQ